MKTFDLINSIHKIQYSFIKLALIKESMHSPINELHALLEIKEHVKHFSQIAKVVKQIDKYVCTCFSDIENSIHDLKSINIEYFDEMLCYFRSITTSLKVKPDCLQ